MSMIGNPQVGDEARFPHSPDVVWPVLRGAVESHERITTAELNDVIRRAEFKTGITMATWGQSMSATVMPDGTGSRVVVSGVGKWATMGGRDQARVRKVAGELLSRMAQALAEVPVPIPGAPEAGPVSVADELTKLAALVQGGIITQEQFEAQKTKLLA